MKNLLDKAAIIKLKLEGLSNRAVGRALGIDKKTVNKYWNQYKENILKLDETNDAKEIKQIQENITSAPKYNSENTVFCEMTPKDKKYCIYFDEISEKILKNVPEQNKKYVKKQLDQLDKNFMDYLYYWNEKYYRNGFADVIELFYS